ncbi:hypothetical protein [Paramicrobacterium fandaimingii]|uniref:hypothetical protein n=1 Tax=Paramicrobacterium fandaimingii TaxID=2708079 RepID=UPI001422AA27|nr:hypothetical protein [Microbacterium fandaimingii]
MTVQMPIRPRDVPWLIVLLLVAVFQLIRGAWVDAAFFVAALVAATLCTWVRGSVRGTRASPGLVMLAVGIGLLTAVVLIAAPRHGLATGILVCIIGLAAAYVAIFGRHTTARSMQRTTPDGAETVLRRARVAWGSLILIAGVWEATAYLTWKWGLLADGTMPSMSDVLDPVLNSPVGKSVFVVAWLAAGIFLMMRAWPGRGRRE